MATDRHDSARPAAEHDQRETPFELPPIEGMPFPSDSEEARAIRRLIEEAEREHTKSAG
jgi:hypothetical protein